MILSLFKISVQVNFYYNTMYYQKSFSRRFHNSCHIAILEYPKKIKSLLNFKRVKRKIDLSDMTYRNGFKHIIYVDQFENIIISRQWFGK